MPDKFYQFNKIPFIKGIPTTQLFMAEAQEEALMRLKYIVNNKMFATVTGDCGTGKTTVLRKLRDSLDEKIFDFLYITDSKLTPRHFYNGLLGQLGREGAFYRGDCRRKLHQEVELISGVRHRQLVVVVDEAHLLDTEMLEELRFLLNFKMDSVSPLALILSGQNDLENTLEKRACRAIRQRIDIRCKLFPLNLKETGEYISHQLHYAGVKNPIFSESAIKEIFGYTSGSARLINKVCNSCLIFGASKKEKIVDGDMVKEIIENEFK
jgi:type II secretory pathway predicted ATPase ExeA